MFLQVSVILFMGGAWSRGWCLLPGEGRGYLLLGDVCSQEVPAPGGGACSQGGAWWRPPPPTAIAVGGTHPTGMHSCYMICMILRLPFECNSCFITFFDCDKSLSRVNVLIDIHATHSEIKSLLLFGNENTILEINATFYLNQSQSQSLSHHVNGP